MTVMSLVVVQAKSLKIATVFLKEEKICCKMVYLLHFKPIVRNHVAKLEFTQTKNRLF